MALVLAVVAAGRPVSADQVSICLKVAAQPEGQTGGLRRLAKAELGHHGRTHRLVEEGCLSTLEVQLFVVDGVRYLTVRIDQQVPVRHSFRDAGELGSKLSKAVARVLRHDPEYLKRDITRLSGLQRFLHSILKRGHNRYRLELFQSVARSGAGAVSAPGGALCFARGADHFQVFARLYFAGTPGRPARGRTLKIYSGADLGLIYELGERSSTTFYVGGGVGAQLLSYEGRLASDDPDSLETAIKVGATVSARVGARFFRAYDFDLDLFAVGYVPLFNTRDPDSTLMDHYTPSVLLGLGVGF
jgi:hypothetical protein